jgi:hypothetical protein
MSQKQRHAACEKLPFSAQRELPSGSSSRQLSQIAGFG